MEEILIFGHQNPDTDTITSSLVYAYLKERKGGKVKPIRLGAINPETQFVLRHFDVDPPMLYTDSVKGLPVILLDHNEFAQSAKDIDKARILEVIDHHRIADFKTDEPLYYRAAPVGCTATIIYKLFGESNISIPAPIAGLMLSAIISDTLLFKSPTTTQEDIAVAHALAKIAQIDITHYGVEMLKAGTDLSAYSAQDLITLDAKRFELAGNNVVVAQVNTVSVSDTLQRKSQLERQIIDQVERDNLSLFVFVITDIINSHSTALVYGDKRAWVEQAFGIPVTDHTVLLEGVVSRKKQIIPQLTRAAQED